MRVSTASRDPIAEDRDQALSIIPSFTAPAVIRGLYRAALDRDSGGVGDAFDRQL